MTDTNIFRVEQVRVNYDVIDEEWEKDYLSDDDMIIVNEIDAAAMVDADNEEEEEEEVKHDVWVDHGADRLILEALAGDYHAHNHHHLPNSAMQAQAIGGAGAGAGGSAATSNGAATAAINPSLAATHFLPQVPNH